MKKPFFILLLFLFHIPCFPQTTLFSSSLEDSLRGFLSKERACFDVYFYDLSLSINITSQRINGSNTVHFVAQEDFTIIQLDLYKNMSILSITDCYDSILTYTRKGNAVFINFREIQKKGNKSFLTLRYEGEPRKALDPPWDGGFIWTTDSLNRPWVAIACEGVGASLWWPCKEHPTDEPDSMRMRYEVPEALYCASNGNLTNITSTERHTKIYEWNVHYPINLYNVTLNIGYYVHFSDDFPGNSFPLDYYVLSYNFEKAKKHFEQVKPMLACYEKLFGNYPYPKDGYALIDCPYWGMEHQSGIAYGNGYINNMIGKLDYIIVHESGHEWWGNQVSASDHADLWIHEAFTTYGENLLLECLYGADIALNYLVTQKKSIKNEEPLLGPKDVNYHYWKDADMYYKGAWMLHTLRNAVDNDSLWFALFPAIQKNFSGKQISTSELLEYINKFLGYNYKPFFYQYLSHTGLPMLQYQVVKKDKNKIQLRYRWKADVKNFSLPLVVVFGNAKRVKIFPSDVYKTETIYVERAKQNFTFNENLYYVLFKHTKHDEKE